MAKESGLNVRLYVSGYDLSGDANSLSAVGYTNEQYEVTTLDLSATARLLGKVDGTLAVNGYFDNAANKIHAVLSGNSGKIPTADVNVLVPLSSTAGDPCYGLVAKEAEYNTERSDSGPVTVYSSFAANGYAPQFGEMITTHQDTASSGTVNSAVVDSGASSSNGASGFLQVFSVASGTPTIKVQHATSSGGTYTDLVSFTAVTDRTSEYKEATGTVNRYLRYNVTGTYSNVVFAVGLSRS
jgi:hypothetical protein